MNSFLASSLPFGKVIRVNSLPCKVVAVLHPKGLSLSGQDQGDTILLPYTTAQKKLKGITWLDDILCSAVSQDVVKMAGQEATAVLRDRHHLRPEEEDDFNIRNPEDIIQAQLDASKTLTILRCWQGADGPPVLAEPRGDGDLVSSGGSTKHLLALQNVLSSTGGFLPPHFPASETRGQ